MLLPLPLRAALLALAAPLAAAVVTDCGSPAFAFSSMSIGPDPPVPGQAAFLNSTGTLKAAVSGGNVSISVLYLGLDLYSATAFTCGNTVIELPLDAGVIDLVGFTGCPAAANSVQSMNMSVTLPTVVPPGDYVILLNASDAALNPILCLNVSFSE